MTGRLAGWLAIPHTSSPYSASHPMALTRESMGKTWDRCQVLLLPGECHCQVLPLGSNYLCLDWVLLPGAHTMLLALAKTMGAADPNISVRPTLRRQHPLLRHSEILNVQRIQYESAPAPRLVLSFSLRKLSELERRYRLVHGDGRMMPETNP